MTPKALETELETKMAETTTDEDQDTENWVLTSINDYYAKVGG